ncbi:MAG: hypothetical protein IPG09_15470 [Ignavibacteria bacterium]|nr:hypothetical protein [Ignavibacteria bacterium]
MPVAVAVTLKSSDSVKGDVTVTQPVQVTVQVAAKAAVQASFKASGKRAERTEC